MPLGRADPARYVEVARLEFRGRRQRIQLPAAAGAHAHPRGLVVVAAARLAAAVGQRHVHAPGDQPTDLALLPRGLHGCRHGALVGRFWPPPGVVGRFGSLLLSRGSSEQQEANGSNAQRPAGCHGVLSALGLRADCCTHSDALALRAWQASDLSSENAERNRGQILWRSGDLWRSRAPPALLRIPPRPCRQVQ